MGFKNTLRNKVIAYLNDDYIIEKVDKIPQKSNTSIGKKAYEIPLCAFFIDLRNSTEFMNIHNNKISGIIHKAYLTVVSSVIKKYKGEIRSFQGDGVLAFWIANTKENIRNAVKASMEITWFLSDEFSPLFEKYQKLNFGIGLDWSKVHIFRVGDAAKDNENDHIFIGECVNLAASIANKAKAPYYIRITDDIYANLDDNLKQKNNKDIWERGSIDWHGKKKPIKITKELIGIKTG